MDLRCDNSPIRAAASALAGAASIATVLLSGCALLGPAEDPAYVGTNLVAGLGFADTIDLDRDGTADERVWQVADGPAGLNLDPTVALDYVVWTEHLGAAPGGDAPDGTVFLLESPNLIPNGDFEAGTPPAEPTGWLSAGVPNARLTDDPTLLDPDINGTQALELRFDSDAARYGINLPGQMVVPAAFELDALFAYFIDFRITTDPIPFALNSATATSEQFQVEINRNEDNVSASLTYSAPGAERSDEELRATSEPAENTFVVEDLAYDTLSIGGFNAVAQSIMNGVIDNLRLVRADHEYGVRARLSLPVSALPSGGDFRVAFKIARDPTIAGGNRFDAEFMRAEVRVVRSDTGAPITASGVSIALRELDEVDSNGDGAPDQGWTNGTWIDYSASFRAPDLTFADGISGGNNDVYLVLTVGDLTQGPAYMHPGAVLIADPVLVYSR